MFIENLINARLLLPAQVIRVSYHYTLLHNPVNGRKLVVLQTILVYGNAN